jgi:hypothetical protein
MAKEKFDKAILDELFNNKKTNKSLRAIKEKEELSPDKRAGESYKNKVVRLTIKEEDSKLLKLLKEELNNSDFKYRDFIGKESINYATFYSFDNTNTISFKMFEKFLKLMNKKCLLTIVDKPNITK